VRLDPTPEGRWQRHEEVCLADLAAQRLGMPVSFVIGAYQTSSWPCQRPMAASRT
jgi:hypothetical protein